MTSAKTRSYAAAKDEQSKVEGRILELETMLAKTRIVDEEKLDTNKVAIGLTVTLQELSPPKKRYTYMLVGSEELSSSGDAPRDVQHISQRSPVGQAILGRIVGDEVYVKVPKGARHLKIVKIERAERKKAKV